MTRVPQIRDQFNKNVVHKSLPKNTIKIPTFVDNLPLDIRTWTCEHCQTTHDRDINASINIRNEALRILSLGTSETANGGSVR